MDRCSLDVAVEDVTHLSLGMTQSSDVKINTKRHATYFHSGSVPSFATNWDVSDDRSTWEFTAPQATTACSSSSTCETTRSAAQEIAFRYRAGLTLDFLDTPSSTLGDSHETPWATPRLDDGSISKFVSATPEPEIKAIFRQSRCDSLIEFRQEALTVMKESGLGEHDVLICKRPGCRDTLRDVKALTYHLHIHSIHDRSFACSNCDGCYETRRELTMHICKRRVKSLPASPIRDSFCRVLSRISSCNKTSCSSPVLV